MANVRQELADQFDCDLTFADGFDSAIIGVCTGFDSGRVVYSIPKMVDICTREAGLSVDDALEYLEYNTFGSYIGKNTPLYLYPIDENNKREQ